MEQWLRLAVAASSPWCRPLMQTESELRQKLEGEAARRAGQGAADAPSGGWTRNRPIA